MQSAGEEGTGEEGRFSQDEKDTKSQEDPDKAAEDCGVTAPSAQEVWETQLQESSDCLYFLFINPLWRYVFLFL